jgi:predicted dehydrogenase
MVVIGDTHLDYAMPFIKKGKPVFIDKPLVGNLSDCEKVLELAKNGAIILGASSVRYCYEIKEFMRIPVEERGEIISITATSGVDEFNYGIHVVEGINALAGSGAKSVKFIGRSQVDKSYCESYCIEFEDGIMAVYHTMTGCWQPFVFTIITTKNTYYFKIDSSRLYNALVNEVCDYMENKPNHMATPEELVKSVRIMLAGKASREQNGATIKLSEIPEKLIGFNGTVFAKGYGDASGAMYAQK